jgi:hypothetical protein
MRYVPHPVILFADLGRFEEATHRTTRWLDRCIAAHKRPNEQNLFPIVQVRRLLQLYTCTTAVAAKLGCLTAALEHSAHGTCVVMLCCYAVSKQPTASRSSRRDATLPTCKGCEHVTARCCTFLYSVWLPEARL